MPELATFDDLATLIAFQEAAYAGNRAIKGVEPLPLQVDYRDILARMEVWIDGPKAEPNGVIILDLDHEPTGTELFLWSIATAPKARGTGLGNALLDFVENRARALGRSAVSLATNSRLKDRIAWYQRRGFTISHYEELPDRTLVGMRKTISDPAKA